MEPVAVAMVAPVVVRAALEEAEGRVLHSLLLRKLLQGSTRKQSHQVVMPQAVMNHISIPILRRDCLVISSLTTVYRSTIMLVLIGRWLEGHPHT